MVMQSMYITVLSYKNRVSHTFYFHFLKSFILYAAAGILQFLHCRIIKRNSVLFYFTVTHLHFKRFDVVNIDVSVSQSVNKVSRLKGQRKKQSGHTGKSTFTQLLTFYLFTVTRNQPYFKALNVLT